MNENDYEVLMVSKDEQSWGWVEVSAPNHERAIVKATAIWPDRTAKQYRKIEREPATNIKEASDEAGS